MRISPGAFRACAIACLCVASGAAMAQVLYKWTDAQGKTYYGDRPAKGALNVTRVEIDPPGDTVKLPPAPKAAVEGAKEEKPAPDMATQRRDLRNLLEDNLAKARDKLEAAKRALAGAEPGEDERQFVQQRQPAGVGGTTGSSNTSDGRPMGGTSGMSVVRRNCREVAGRDGTVVVCPVLMPNEKYRERVAQLEEAVKAAEEDVAKAEYAYRRGVD
jgi:hypothetical protein